MTRPISLSRPWAHRSLFTIGGRLLPLVGLVAAGCSASTELDSAEGFAALSQAATGVALPVVSAGRRPILFVTQVPDASDFASVVSTFATQGARSAVRGGDLYIRYADGSFKNLTGAACYGVPSSAEPANPRCTGPRYPIAVRNPAVDWSGKRAIFSMVVDDGKTTSHWQLYEVIGFGQGEVPTITKVPNQPNENNIYPTYGTDGRIIFSSDRRRRGESYPQLDEYDEAQAITGLWSLDPRTGDLFLMNHTPSGAFSPFVDSFGRVVFARWDHFDRDQQNASGHTQHSSDVFPRNFVSEDANAAYTNDPTSAPAPEVYPEPWAEDQVAAYNAKYFPPSLGYTITRHNLVFKQFFPWQINEDGTGEETLNHVGRHELTGGAGAAVSGDPAIVSTGMVGANKNGHELKGMEQISEDPIVPGVYYAIDTPEFNTHASGSLVELFGPAGIAADQMTLTTRSRSSSGHYRTPVRLGDGTMIAVHADTNDPEKGGGVKSTYAFRLKRLDRSGTEYAPAGLLTPGFSKPNVAGGATMWELDPVEVYARPLPHGSSIPVRVEAPEQALFDSAKVSVAAMKDYLKKNGLALLIMRNLTTRDHADRQQPYNLQVHGGGAKTVGNGGKVYDLAYLQLFQGDMLRAAPFGRGRRVIAQYMHDAPQNPPLALDGGPVQKINPELAKSGVKIMADGSAAVFVPARRAMTWQTTDGNGSPVVLERYWLSFQPGEIRTCPSCHGVNSTDQAGHPSPTNSPQALARLLDYWKTLPH